MKGMVKMKDEDKWKAESDMRTMMEAEAIKKDPKRMEAAIGMMNEQIKNMMSASMSMEEKAKDRFPKTYKKE